MSPDQKAWLEKAQAAAAVANHPFPAMAACEAAEESAYGTSILARYHNNLFGMKQHAHPIFNTVNLPTREFIDTHWIRITIGWVDYPDWASCFVDRKDTLERLKNNYPHYKAALQADDPETYIREVSATWSTDPDRAEKILTIYRASQAEPTA